ncbi:FtsX-like permease family protein [Tessaracoccus rhinocerotis]|uniref:FtsX-like permease family protein n=1 Tax=Tessaracoccus rhinocerotis TaxID=1689449 RepID=A0A553K5M8_9ACTN|nr:FtsX-like permease family protein [Tessaracoccus rhinocerotis]
MPGVRELRALTWRSLRRNRASAAILVGFMALATMLAASAAALVVTATGASESLMRQARTPHFLQMHAGDVDLVRMAAFAMSNPLVEQWAVSEILNVDGAAVRIVGDGVDTTLAEALQDNSFVTQNAGFDLLLDTDGEVIAPTPGTVWLPLFYFAELDLAVGNVLWVTGPGGRTQLEVAGFLRDSQMNSSYASSKRLLVSAGDLERVRSTVADAGAVEHLVQFRLTDPAAATQFEEQYRAAGLEASGPTVTWALFVLVNSISEGVTAAIAILVTVLLVGIALLCVRFTLLTTIEQDHRQIGTLMAIGTRRRDLRRLYSRRYLAMALAGAVVGLLGALGLSRVLLARVELFLGPSGRELPAIALGVALAALLVCVVVLSVHRTLRALERISPVRALRTDGAAPAGVPRRPPRWLSVADGALGTNTTLGLGDLWRRPGLYVVPLVVHTLAVFVLVVPQNLYTTVTSPGFVTSMGAGVSDMLVGVRPPVEVERAAELAEELAADPRVERHTMLVTAAYSTTTVEGTRASLRIESGDLGMFPISYTRGRAPVEPGQLAVSALQADALGVDLGDVVVAEPVGGGEPLELAVVGVYQDITNGGRTAKMVMPHTSSEVMWSTLQADFTPGFHVGAAISGYAATNPDVRVSSVRDHVAASLGGTVDALGSAAVAAVLVGLAVAALVTALFMRLLVARDAARTATLRALGFRDHQIRRQSLVRSTSVLVAGVLLGTLLAHVVGGPLAGFLLAPAGLTELTLGTNPWLAHVASPAALLLVVVGTTLASTRSGVEDSIALTTKE